MKVPSSHDTSRESGIVVLERLSGDALRPRKSVDVGRLNVQHTRTRECTDVETGRVVLAMRGTLCGDKGNECQGKHKPDTPHLGWPGRR